MSKEPNEKQSHGGAEEDNNEGCETEEEDPTDGESYEGSGSAWGSNSGSAPNSSSESGHLLLLPPPSLTFDPLVKPIGSRKAISAKRSARPGAQISKNRRRTADKGGRKKDLFMRIWSKEDELVLLQGILDYKKRHHVVPFTKAQTGSLLESVKGSLSIRASLNQITEKVRRMRRMYNTTSERLNRAKNPNISDAHKAAVFDISKKVWESVDIHDNKIDLEKMKENINKEKGKAKYFAEEYPYLHRHVVSEHANNALLVQSNIPVAEAKELNGRCNKLEMTEIDLNLQKIELFPSALKLIQDALARFR